MRGVSRGTFHDLRHPNTTIINAKLMANERPTNVARPTGRLSDPSCRYLAALYDPKSCAEPPSVPKSTQLSQKVKTFVRGSLNTGTTGYGVLELQPSIMCVNDTSAGLTTTATSVMTPSTGFTSATNTVNLPLSNSPFASGAFGTSATSLAWKLVGCAIYFKYAGTELNRGGDAIMLEQPAHASLGATSYNTSLSFDYAKRVPIINDWQHLCYTPQDVVGTAATTGIVETDFCTVFPQNVGAFYLAVAFNTAGAPQPIDYEIYAWFEVVGQSARGATMSYADPIGFAAVIGAAEAFQQLDSVIGADGFIHAVEDQLDNMSGVGRNATHKQNWAGLAAFLPQLKEVATRALSGMANGALKEFGYKKAKPKVPMAKLPPPPPPRRQVPQAPPPPLKTQLMRAAANLKKR